jgi:hypothetical protein
MPKAPAKAQKDDGKPMPEALPESVTLASLYGFMDDDGAVHMWSPGQVVTDPAEIETLLERDAPLVTG